MKLRISDDSVTPLILVAIPTRVCFGVLIDMPRLYCAGWLAALLGGLMALPVMWVAARRDCRRWLTPLFALCALWDGASMLRALAHTVEYAALDGASSYLPMLPVVILCGFCLCVGGNAIGGTARLWTRILPILLLIVVVCEASEFRLGWLFPLLGSGFRGIADGALCAAGWFTLPAALILTVERDPKTRKKPWHPVKITLVCALISAALIALHGLMTPPLVKSESLTRFFLLDTVLSNGRAPLSLQLPLSVAAFAGLLILLLFDALSAAVMLKRLLPKWKEPAVAALAMLLIALLAATRLCGRENTLIAARWIFVAEGLLILFSKQNELSPKSDFQSQYQPLGR